MLMTILTIINDIIIINNIVIIIIIIVLIIFLFRVMMTKYWTFICAYIPAELIQRPNSNRGEDAAYEVDVQSVDSSGYDDVSSIDHGTEDSSGSFLSTDS